MKNQDKKIHIQTTISKINIDHLKQVIELYVDLIPQLKSISLVATVNQGNTFNNGISLAKSELIKIKEFKEEYNMTQQDAKKVLWLLAQRSSDFERLAAEYLPLLMPDAELPDTLPGQVLDTLRSDPEMARAIDNVNLSVNLGELAGKAENYSITDLATPELIIAILVLLSMSFKLKYRNGSWSFDFGYKSPDIKALTQILQILANAVTDKLGKGLAELSESLSDSEKETKETDS